MVSTTKTYTQESVFKPENLLREARRQKNISACDIPKICVLDPDGDILAYLQESKRTRQNKCWACYHTVMYEFEIDGNTIGIIANAVGAPFAVLLAEQMFVSGCELLISITSAGIINMPGTNPEYILITKALRDEGTSYHYLPPSLFCELPQNIKERSSAIVENKHLGVSLGTSWTTDAPYRETSEAIENAKAKNINVVEMEAAALYAFARAKNKAIICFAHITNSMAQKEGDFEKGEKSGSIHSLELIQNTIEALGDIVSIKAR